MKSNEILLSSIFYMFSQIQWIFISLTICIFSFLFWPKALLFVSISTWNARFWDRKSSDSRFGSVVNDFAFLVWMKLWNICKESSFNYFGLESSFFYQLCKRVHLLSLLSLLLLLLELLKLKGNGGKFGSKAGEIHSDLVAFDELWCMECLLDGRQAFS